MRYLILVVYDIRVHFVALFTGNVHGRALDSDLSKRYTTYGPPTRIPSAFPLPVLSYVVLFLLVMDGESYLTELHIPSRYQS